ncbi:hypothetical protein QLH51_03275 [Sphingomonas sp. 2R-10]|nr:hypothetical protein [Sphingomonas sp. 2R-10]
MKEDGDIAAAVVANDPNTSEKGVATGQVPYGRGSLVVWSFPIERIIALPQSFSGGHATA